MFADTFHKTFAEAMAEAAKRRGSLDSAGYITNVDPSPYGGFRVRSTPAEFFVDEMLDGPLAGSLTRGGRTRLRA